MTKVTFIGGSPRVANPRGVAQPGFTNSADKKNSDMTDPAEFRKNRRNSAKIGENRINKI
jgi:hypothetical protein